MQTLFIEIPSVLDLAVHDSCFNPSGLNYVLSKSGLGSNSHGEDEKTSLMSHEYDTVCTEDFSKSHATSTRERSSSPQAIESEYSVIRADHVTRSSKRDSRSRSLTPDTTLTAGAGSGATSYGAVDQEKLADENPYSYVRVDRKRSGPRSKSMHTDPSEAHASEYTPRARATTSVHQVSIFSLMGHLYTPTCHSFLCVCVRVCMYATYFSHNPCHHCYFSL